MRRAAAIAQLRLDFYSPIKGKFCTGTCQRWRPFEDFNRASKRKDGHQAWCRRCIGSARGRIGPVAPAPRVAQPLCKCCLGLSHRRPKRGCARCGEPYRPLEAEIEDERARLRQGFGLGRGFSFPNLRGV